MLRETTCVCQLRKPKAKIGLSDPMGWALTSRTAAPKSAVIEQRKHGARHSALPMQHGAKPQTFGEGVTLIELLVVLVIVALLASVVLPAYSRHTEIARLKAAAEGLYALKRNTKSEAVLRNQPLTVVLGGQGAAWCLGVTDANDCNCAQPAGCQVDGVARVMHGADFPGIQLSYANASRRFVFRPTYGAMAAGSATFTSPSGRQLRVLTSRVGRVRICSPSGPAKVSGYPDC